MLLHHTHTAPETLDSFSIVGSSEAAMLDGLAMKRRCKEASR